ncbi:MAG: hypothetical protein AAFQ43_10935, partial [Bacteroidota bacterium]
MRALALALLLPLAACGSADEAETADEAPSADATTSEGTTTDLPEGVDDAAPFDATEADEASQEPETEADAQDEQASGASSSPASHAEAVVGDWTIDVGPAESVTFGADGTVQFYTNDRLSESGTFSVEGSALVITSNGAAGGTYQLDSQSPTSLAYTGGDNAVADEATMLLTRIPASSGD